eukprot:gb/GECG01013127.1/.p1 GENE.gb/GECG01013127.1/~~gb/GECG01013127.1/.p1  ORF type:complete len:234 (+),score=27.24 gb/GECG01013127.1/:1-702(+)
MRDNVSLMCALFVVDVVQNHWRKRQGRFPHDAGCPDQPPCTLVAPKRYDYLFIRKHWWIFGLFTSLMYDCCFAGMPHFRERKAGERKRKSIRGCIVGSDIAVLNLIVIRKGDNDIPGLTDPESNRPRRLGPKRANNIRKLFNLPKDEDVRKYVITREFERKGRKEQKRPKIQRLVTPLRLHHKRRLQVAKRKQQEKSKRDAQEYAQMVKQRVAERKESAQKRKSSRKSSRVEA